MAKKIDMKSTSNISLVRNDFIDYSYQGQVSGAGQYLCVAPAYPLDRWVQCFWQLTVPSGQYAYRSIPDNNVDIIFPLKNLEQNLFVVPFCEPEIFEIDGPAVFFGVRLRVLAQQWLSKVPVGEWQGESTSDVLGGDTIDRLVEALAIDDGFSKKCGRINEVLLSSLLYRGVDRRLTHFVRYVHQNVTEKIELSDRHCSDFGLSARHLRRLCQLYLGLSPRDFTRVQRFQTMLHFTNDKPSTNIWSQFYYDQPHHIREFRRLTGLTPTEFANLSVLYNQAK